MSLFFSAESLALKLSKLVDSQESVTVLSQYFILHRQNASVAVQTWLAELEKGISLLLIISFCRQEISILTSSQ